MELLLRILKLALAKRWMLEALAFAVAYIFLLRVPSELLGQARAELFASRPRCISYGPIRRKGQRQLRTLPRRCACNGVALLCAHHWAGLALELAAGQRRALLFEGYSAARLLRALHALLRELRIDPSGYTLHSFRRGAAMDVLEKEGLAAMLFAGEWRSAAAFAYPAREEAEARLLGELTAAVSDGDE